VAAALVFAAQTYVIASWSDWQLGASFGHRGFTELLPVAAVYIAECWTLVVPRRVVLLPVAIFATALVVLSTAQMLQYWLGILPTANTTWEQYRQLFLRFS
jgi:hypothetical protein